MSCYDCSSSMCKKFKPHGDFYHKKDKCCKKKECCKSIAQYVEYNKDCFVVNFPHCQDDLSMCPSKKIAIVAPMDCRFDPYQALGIKVGEANIIRNAGGVVTEDVIRSLLVSRKFLGTNEIMLIHNFDSVMRTFDGEELDKQLQHTIGQKPKFKYETFDVARDNLRENYVRLCTNPFIVKEYGDIKCIKAFVYIDVNKATVEGCEYCAGELAPVTIKDLKEKCLCKKQKKKCKRNSHAGKKYHYDYYETDCCDKDYSDCKYYKTE